MSERARVCEGPSHDPAGRLFLGSSVSGNFLVSTIGSTACLIYVVTFTHGM